MRRRPILLLLALALLPVLALAFGAAGSNAAAPAARTTPRPPPLPYVEIVTGGAAADAPLPLVIALHGRGDRPQDFAHLFDGLRVPARVALLRPPHEWNGGYAWFLGGRAQPDSRPAIVEELLALSDRVVATADAVRAARPTRGTPIVMGFSQGAMLTWATAVKHPRAFAAAFPVAGFLFPEMLARVPVDAARMPPIVAFHGTADPLVSIDDDRAGVRLLERRRARVELRVYDGVPHALTPAIRDDLFAALGRVLAP